MRFAYKLAGSVIIILTIVLSLVGYLFVSENFNNSLAVATEQNQTQHLLERYSQELNLVTIKNQYGKITDEKILSQANTQGTYVGQETRQALYQMEGEIVFSTLPEDIVLDGILRQAISRDNKGAYYSVESGNQIFQVFISPLSSELGSFTFVTAHNTTHLFVERDRQLQSAVRLFGIVLLCAIFATIVVSIYLTRPIRRLNIASKRIASGNYDSKCDVETSDELGDLADNFNLMAVSVEDNIDRLNKMVREREDFVAAFTHEIKTPMTSIIGYSDILRHKIAGDERLHKAAQYIFTESSRLESLSQKLLYLMGLKPGDIDFTPCSLRQIVNRTVESITPYAQKNGIVLQAHLQDAAVMAEPDLIVDLLRNLCVNSIHAHPTDKLVRIVSEQDGESYIVKVMDKGEGIPAEDIPRLTEAFYMVDKSRSRSSGGSGVGLALCSRIAELHGTHIEIKSKVGVGTCVQFSLPRE